VRVVEQIGHCCYLSGKNERPPARTRAADVSLSGSVDEDGSVALPNGRHARCAGHDHCHRAVVKGCHF
jgi:hypothetical protein